MQRGGYAGYMALKKQKLAAKVECTILLRDNTLPCHSGSQVKYSCFDYKCKIDIRNTKQSAKLFSCFLENDAKVCIIKEIQEVPHDQQCN